MLEYSIFIYLIHTAHFYQDHAWLLVPSYDSSYVNICQNQIHWTVPFHRMTRVTWIFARIKYTEQCRSIIWLELPEYLLESNTLSSVVPSYDSSYLNICQNQIHWAVPFHHMTPVTWIFDRIKYTEQCLSIIWLKLPEYLRESNTLSSAVPSYDSSYLNICQNQIHWEVPFHHVTRVTGIFTRIKYTGQCRSIIWLELPESNTLGSAVPSYDSSYLNVWHKLTWILTRRPSKRASRISSAPCSLPGFGWALCERLTWCRPSRWRRGPCRTSTGGLCRSRPSTQTAPWSRCWWSSFCQNHLGVLGQS